MPLMGAALITHRRNSRRIAREPQGRILSVLQARDCASFANAATDA